MDYPVLSREETNQKAGPQKTCLLHLRTDNYSALRVKCSVLRTRKTAPTERSQRPSLPASKDNRRSTMTKGELQATSGCI
jgi:hypothetical protein